MASNSKQYGLIVPKKFNINEVKRIPIFNQESDSDDNTAEAGSSDWIKKSYQKQVSAQKSGISRQTEIDMKKALDEDPTVYDYDEIYDDMEKKKQEDVIKKKDDRKKPRYIQNLLKTAQHRKLENERRIERQVQKEREAEGDQFKDKETFVTSAYKKKLEEFHKLDEEERRKDVLEEICDVSKQQDLGGFYRHLYKTTIAKEDNEKKHDIIKEEDECPEVSSAVESKRNTEPVESTKKPRKETRQYRKRKSSESSSLEEGERNSDSDTSISSSSSSSSSVSSQKTDKADKSDTKHDSNKEQPITKKQKKDNENLDIVKNSNKENEPIDTSAKSSKSRRSSNEVNNESNVKPIKMEDTSVTEEAIKVKINIWEKRTVGPVFEAALERYFNRKAERLANRGN